MTLNELTGHEAGIILYGGNAVAVCNWGSCDDDQIPYFLAPIGMIPFPGSEKEGYLTEGVTSEHVEDVRTLLPGSVWLEDDSDSEEGSKVADTDLDIVFDGNGDLIRLFCDETLEACDYEGTIYRLRDGKAIIAPDMWN